ncbi:MAG: 50S ribosomal protein L17 [Erysipelotrichaceae bacterium]|nr:50S ribosomal protein L17 [Erysipelotrichaceae bacterium]
MAKNRKLGRVSSHRKAMLRNLATDVIMYGQIQTTATRAKEVRSVVEDLITLGKRGDLHARRQAAAILQNVVDPATGKTAVQVLFDDVAPKYADKNGGYTRILKTYNRKGDNAPMAVITLL